MTSLPRHEIQLVKVDDLYVFKGKNLSISKGGKLHLYVAQNVDGKSLGRKVWWPSRQTFLSLLSDSEGKVTN